MAIDLEITFSKTNCNLVVKVFDEADRRLPGTVTVVTDAGATIQNKNIDSVKLEKTNVEFDAPSDGLMHQFVVTLTVGAEVRTRRRNFFVC